MAEKASAGKLPPGPDDRGPLLKLSEMLGGILFIFYIFWIKCWNTLSFFRFLFCFLKGFVPRLTSSCVGVKMRPNFDLLFFLPSRLTECVFEFAFAFEHPFKISFAHRVRLLPKLFRLLSTPPVLLADRQQTQLTRNVRPRSFIDERRLAARNAVWNSFLEVDDEESFWTGLRVAKRGQNDFSLLFNFSWKKNYVI